MGFNLPWRRLLTLRFKAPGRSQQASTVTVATASFCGLVVLVAVM
jgi:hypothetical protein